jgi:hypothetical protein
MHKSVEIVADPIALKPKEAAKMGVGGLTQIYEFLKEDRLESYHVGRSRFITTASIRALAAELLAEEKARKVAATESPAVANPPPLAAQLLAKEEARKVAAAEEPVVADLHSRTVADPRSPPAPKRTIGHERTGSRTRTRDRRTSTAQEAL